MSFIENQSPGTTPDPSHKRESWTELIVRSNQATQQQKTRIRERVKRHVRDNLFREPNPHFLPSPESQAQIEALTHEVHTMIKELGVLPEEVMENPYYQVFFKHDFDQEPEALEEFLELHGQRGLMVPRLKNEERIQEYISQMATKICEGLQLDTSNTAALVQAIRIRFQRNLSIFESSKILARENGQEDLAPLDFKIAHKKVLSYVRQGKIKRDDASFAILFLSGVLSKTDVMECRRKPIDAVILKTVLRELKKKMKPTKGNGTNDEDLFEILDTYDLSPIKKDIEESITWSREYIGKTVNLFKDLLAKYEAEGSLKNPVNVPPELNSELASSLDSFDWINTFYDPKAPLRDHNDAHLVLLYGLIYFQEKRRADKLDARYKKSAMEDRLIEALFEKRTRCQAEIPSFKLDRDREEFVETKTLDEKKYKRSLECRQLQINNYPVGTNPDDLVVHLTAMGHKELDSRVRKRLSKGSRHLGPDKMTDEIRVRMVFVNINSKQCDNEDKKSVFENSLLHAAKSQGLGTRRTDLEAQHQRGEQERPGLLLNPGEFIIENELNHERYPKISLLGKLEDGTNIEVQAVPLDTHIVEEAHDSAIAHSIKDEDEILAQLQAGSPQTVSPLVHEVVNKRRKEIENHRAITKRARVKFDRSRLGARINRATPVINQRRAGLSA